ncbi:MAG TPA: rod shape-determining protein [Firmicutes bacterium]|nr:rod shape-determining protein [Bacillota bacterium]
MFGFSTDLGIDLGTANLKVYARGRGVVLREPSVVAVATGSQRILAIGEEARRMLGRTPGEIRAVRPMKDGVIADYDITEALLRHFIEKVSGRRSFIRPRIVICVPAGVTDVERRAVMEAAMQAGARKTYLIEEPVAAAIGAGINISEPSGNMIVDIGGGTTEVAVISLNGIVASESLRIGGDRLDDAIVRYVKRVHNLMIGEMTAEEVKVRIGTAYPGDDERFADVRGRDLVTGLPRTLRLSSGEVFEALAEPVTAIVQGVKSVLERTPPELASDIVDKGIVMMGGGALLRGLPRLLSEETGIPAHLAEDPMSTVVLGAGMILEQLEVVPEGVLVAR